MEIKTQTKTDSKDTLTNEKKGLNTKRKMLFGSVGALAFLTVASIGSITYAATTNTTSSAFLDRVAEVTGIDATKLKSALAQVSTEDIDKKLANGEITQEQATKMKEDIANGNYFGFGGRHPGGKGGMRMIDIEAFAKWLGLTRDQLEQKEHTDGQTWLQIAQAQGKTEADLKKYLSDAFDTQLADAVSKGTITSDRATNMKNEKDSMISRMISESHKGGPRPDQTNQ